VTGSRVTVREARPDEYEAIADATEAAYRAVSDEATDDYLRVIRGVAARARAATVLVAVDESGAVVGSVTYVDGPANRFAELERDGEAGMRMLAVAPAAQGKGIGRLLARAVVDRARAEGRTGLAIYTRPSMTSAHRLYRSMGFVRDTERDWEFAPGEWLWAMALRF
jgi:ribosomal protein S18 acetylase RimI-like enzyme